MKSWAFAKVLFSSLSKAISFRCTTKLIDWELLLQKKWHWYWVHVTKLVQTTLKISLFSFQRVATSPKNLVTNIFRHRVSRYYTVFQSVSVLTKTFWCSFCISKNFYSKNNLGNTASSVILDSDYTHTRHSMWKVYWGWVCQPWVVRFNVS